MKKFLKIVGILLLTVILVSVAGFVIWGLTPLGPTQQALAALESNALVRVEDARDWIVFIPNVPADDGASIEPIETPLGETLPADTPSVEAPPTATEFIDAPPTATPDPLNPPPPFPTDVLLPPTFTPEVSGMEPTATPEAYVPGTPISAFIFYPGGHVDYRSYAPLLRKVAERGYMVVLVKMPLSLAVFGLDKADAVIAAYPDIRYWSIGGHSLGGSMAASYANKHLDQIQGLIFLASYPASSDDLSKTELKGLSVYGSKDSVLNAENMATTEPLLPPGTILEVIEGGNHAQFGNYGLQPGDSEAEISPDQQQEQAVTLIARLLRAVEGE